MHRYYCIQYCVRGKLLRRYCGESGRILGSTNKHYEGIDTLQVHPYLLVLLLSLLALVASAVMVGI